eukprot:gene6863-12462_t
MAKNPGSLASLILNSSAINGDVLQTVNTAAKDVSTGGSLTATSLAVTLFLCIVMIVSLVGNTLVLVTFRISDELNRVSDYFIINLSISDLTVTVFSIPFWMSYVLTGWPNNRSGTIYTLWISLDIFCGCWSIMSLAMISIERYFCIVYPMRYENIVTKQRGMTVVVFVLAYSTMASILGYIQATTGQAIVSVCIVILSYVIPIIIKGFTYGRIYGEVKRQIKFMVQVEKDRQRFLASQEIVSGQEDEYDSEGSTPKKPSRSGILTKVEDGSKKTTFFQKLRFLQRILGGNKQKDVVKKGEYFTGGGGRGIDVCSQLQRDGIEDWEAYLDDLERRTSKPYVSLNVASAKGKFDLDEIVDAGAISSDHCLTSQVSTEAEGRRVQLFNDRQGQERNGAEISIADISVSRPALKIQTIKKHSKNSKGRKISSWRFKKETKGAKVIGAIIGTFLLLWTPFIMIVVLSILSIRVSTATIMAVKCLHYANSAINPILYIVLNIALRKEVKKVLSKAANLKCGCRDS